MSFIIITLDGSSVSVGSQQPISQANIVVAGNDPNGLAQPVTRDNPMPSATYYGNSGRPAIVHVFNAPGEASPDAFHPLAGRPFNVDLIFSNDAAARIQLERSFDQGTTWNAVTAEGQPVANWGASASEHFVENEVGVSYRLNMTERTGGTVAARMSQ